MAEDKKTQWELERLQRKTNRHEERLDKQDEELTEFRSFKDSTVEKLISIFNTIDEMKEDSKWMKRMFTTTLMGGIVTGIISLVIWLIQS